MESKGIAKPLKMAMIEKGITQNAVADKIGITPQALNNILQRDNLTFAKASAIADALDCDVVLIDSKTKNIC